MLLHWNLLATHYSAGCQNVLLYCRLIVRTHVTMQYVDKYSLWLSLHMLFCMLLLLLHMACFHYMLLDYNYLLLHNTLLLQVWHEEVVSVCSDGEEELPTHALPQLDPRLERRSLHLLHPAEVPGQGDARLPIFLGRNLTYVNKFHIYRKSIHSSLSNAFIFSGRSFTVSASVSHQGESSNLLLRDTCDIVSNSS